MTGFSIVRIFLVLPAANSWNYVPVSLFVWRSEEVDTVSLQDDPGYARLPSELRMEADTCVLRRKQTEKNTLDETVTRQPQTRLQSLISAVEKPAEAAELEIWREPIDSPGNGIGV